LRADRPELALLSFGILRFDYGLTPFRRGGGLVDAPGRWLGDPKDACVGANRVTLVLAGISRLADGDEIRRRMDALWLLPVGSQPKKYPTPK